jgi:ribosomal protein S6
MTTHFITAEIDLHQTPVKLKQEIEEELQKRGEVLRWAIAQVDKERQKVQVEAIVTTLE